MRVVQVDENNVMIQEGVVIVEKNDKTLISYSEEEVLNILVEHTVELFKGQPCTLTEFFEQFKKK